MAKFFNTAGPCRGDSHYMLNPVSRFGDIRKYIDDELYFMVHAPRQTGKTTTLEALAKAITAEGKYTALRFSCEMGQPFGGNIEKVEDVIIESILHASRYNLSTELQCPNAHSLPSAGRIKAFLTNWAQTSPRPLVLFFDEIDAIVDESLIGLLRQLRDGFSDKLCAFPQSIVLCGLNNMRDGKVFSGDSEPLLGAASRFNIEVDSLRLSNFTEADVAELYDQHTAETSQAFEPEAKAKAFELTGGQLWLVNALANHVVRKMGIPATRAIKSFDIEKAAQEIILGEPLYQGAPLGRIREEPIQHILEAMLSGKNSISD
jgi:hypothetical protein